MPFTPYLVDCCAHENVAGGDIITLSTAADTRALYLFIFLSGYRLSRSEKSHDTITLTIHKLTSLGAALTLAIPISQKKQAPLLSTIELTATAVTGLIFIPSSREDRSAPADKIRRS